jgi:hypothetical protein
LDFEGFSSKQRRAPDSYNAEGPTSSSKVQESPQGVDPSERFLAAKEKAKTLKVALKGKRGAREEINFSAVGILKTLRFKVAKNERDGSKPYAS